MLGMPVQLSLCSIRQNNAYMNGDDCSLLDFVVIDMCDLMAYSMIHMRIAA